MAEPRSGVTIDHSRKASIVGIGVTCPISWSYSKPSTGGTTTRILEERVQKFLICALVHLDWKETQVARAIKGILNYPGQSLLPSGTHMEQISDYIHDSFRKSHRNGNEQELFYWEAITRFDEEWCDWAKRDRHYTEASLADMPILVKTGQDQFHCGIPGYIPIRPQRLSWTAAVEDLRDRPGLKSTEELEAKYQISVRNDSSGYTLYDITLPRGAKVRPELQKFLICTVFYHPFIWTVHRAITPARAFFPTGKEGLCLIMDRIFEILRCIEIQVRKYTNPANMSTLTKKEYWSHIMEYDYRWLDYGELWDSKQEPPRFTGNRPPVIDPPLLQKLPRYHRTGRPVLRNPDGRILQPPSTGTIQANHKQYFSAEYAEYYRQKHSSDLTMNPANGLPYEVVESGLSSEIMGDKAWWPIPGGDVGKKLPRIATDGFLIADQLPPAVLNPAAAAEGQKRARESSSATPGSRSSGDYEGPEQRGRQQGGHGGHGGQSSRSSSKADPRSQSSSGRQLTKAEGKQPDRQRRKH